MALRLLPNKPSKTEPPPPLVLFMPGAPAWNHRGRRPQLPESQSPGFLVEKLKAVGFDRDGRFQLVVLESPGRVPKIMDALRSVMAILPTLVAFDKERVFLVGDRQGASGLASLAVGQPKAFRGLVVCNGGVEVMTLNNLGKLGGLPTLVVPGHGHAGGNALIRHHKIAVEKGKADHVSVLEGKTLPWPIALPLAAARIEAFVKKAAGF